MEQHQRQQSHHLGLRQQLVQEPRQADRLAREIGARQRFARRGGVPLVEHEVDHLQHRVQPLRQFGRRRHLVGDAGVADLGLGAHDALGQRGRRGQEGARDLLGRETADLPQRQRDARFRRQGGVAAGEDQPQPVVLDALVVPFFLVLGVVVDLLGERRQRGVEPGAPPDAVDGLEPAGRDQPGARDWRHAIARPLSQRGAKASCSASSARSKSPSRRMRVAKTRRDSALVDVVHQPAYLLGRVGHRR